MKNRELGRFMNREAELSIIEAKKELLKLQEEIKERDHKRNLEIIKAKEELEKTREELRKERIAFRESEKVKSSKEKVNNWVGAIKETQDNKYDMINILKGPKRTAQEVELEKSESRKAKRAVRVASKAADELINDMLKTAESNENFYKRLVEGKESLEDE